MDELPREARELLTLASEGYDAPSAEVRARVRRGVAMAVAVGAGAAVAGHAVAQGSVKAGLFSGLAGKLAGAGMAVAVAGSLAVAAPHLARQVAHVAHVAHVAEVNPHRAKSAQPARVAATAPAPVSDLSVAAEPVQQLPAPAAELALPAREPASHPVRKHAARHRAHAPRATSLPVEVDGLRAEMALLKRASQAIADGDTLTAERALEQHAIEYRASVLREERDGLSALVHCMQSPVRARREAERFVSRAPDAVVAQRVVRACKLGEEP